MRQRPCAVVIAERQIEQDQNRIKDEHAKKQDYRNLRGEQPMLASEQALERPTDVSRRCGF